MITFKIVHTEVFTVFMQQKNVNQDSFQNSFQDCIENNTMHKKREFVPTIVFVIITRHLDNL